MADLGAFVKANMGKGIDVDGHYGPQCWDLAQAWATAVGAGTLSTQGGPHPGYAEGCWYAPQPGFSKVLPTSPPAPGDLVVWRWGLSTMPLSHIAIYLRDSKVPGTVRTFSQNSPLPVSLEQTLPTFGVLGYLRPANVTGTDTRGSMGEGVKERVEALNPLDKLDISGITDVAEMLRDPVFWKRVGILFAGAFLLLIVVISVAGKAMTDVPIVNEVI